MLLILVLIKACIDALQLLGPVVMQWQCFWAPFSYGNNIGAVYCSHSFLGRWFGLVHDLDSKLCLVVCNSFERWWASWPVEFWHLYHNFDIVQTFEAIVLCFYNNRICVSIYEGKGNYSIIILTNQLDVKLADFSYIATVNWQVNFQLSLADRVLDWAFDIKAHQWDSGLQIKTETEVLDVLHIVLLVVARDKLKIILLLRRHVLSITFNLDVRLCLFWALQSNEIRTILIKICALLVNLVPESVLRCICRHRQSINLINLHWFC